MLFVIPVFVVVVSRCFVVSLVCKHKTASVPDAKGKTLLGCNTLLKITPLFVTECKWKEVRRSLPLAATNHLDGIKVGLAKAKDAIVAVVGFRSKIRELDHHRIRFFFSRLP